MRSKIINFLLAAFLVSGFPLLSACVPGMATDNHPSTVEVSQITTPIAKPDMPPLYCKAGRGSALFGREWYDFSDTTFPLQQGTSAHIKISRQRSTEEMTIHAFFDGNGQKIIFCPFVVEAAPTERISCSSLYALEGDLKEGIKRTFDIPSAVRGGVITCAYDQEKLQSLVTPAAGGN